jgi:hypothetical protein
MNAGRIIVLAAVALCLAPAPAWSAEETGWWSVHRADASFDLVTARQTALATVANDPTGADAVAAAGWWLRQIANLPYPEEILGVAGDHRDPELGFLLARIEAALDGRPPSGSIITAEVAGPYGIFDSLDLERGVVPVDDDLPAPDTPFVNPWDPVRYRLTTLDGSIGPPEVLAPRGVFAVMWTVDIDETIDGWMAVEAEGSFDFRLDGRPVDGRRYCGLQEARVAWYRVRLAPGLHRIRADLSARGRPELRISLYDLEGVALDVRSVTGKAGSAWADSDLRAEEPPAMRALDDLLRDNASIETLLLAASIFEQRRDSANWRRLIERAVEIDTGDPWPRLAMTWYWLTAPIQDDAEAVRRRARENLRRTSEIPISLFFERGVALRERRNEDDERILDTLVETHGDDPRVIRMWIREALRRGWVREAEDGLVKLQSALPGSKEASEVEIEVLEALERWQERQRLLRALANTEPHDLRLVDELADGCLVADAVGIVQQLKTRTEDPDLDVELIRLLFTAGMLDRASVELDDLRQRWGALRVADELALAISAGDPEATEQLLADAIARSPSSLELLTLAWRRGKVPFYEPHRLSLAEIVDRVEDSPDDVDAVLLLDQAVEKVFDDGSSLYYYHGVTRALTPVGARQASRLQQLPNSHRLKIRIHKPDGSVVVPASLGDGSGAVQLDDVEPGDLVEEEYVARVAPTAASQRGHLPPYIYRFADSERAFGLSEYLLLVPTDIELLVEGNIDGLERSEWEVDGRRAIKWRAEGVPPVPEERFAPPTSELLPWVSYGFGVTWQDIGDAIRDRLIPILSTTPELHEWSDALLSRTDGDPIEALVNGVVDEVELDRGVLDFSTSAGASFSRRRGNRMGIVAAVLIDAGWDVDLIMARTRPFAGTHLVVPTFDSFFLPLLHVAKDGRELWLDIEQERQGINHIDPILQGSDGLLIPLNRPTERVRIVEELPTFANPDLEEEMRVSAAVDDSGDAQITVTLPIVGPQAERVMEQIRSVPTERVPMVYQQMAANFVPSASEVSGRVDRITNGIELSLTMHAPGVCRREDESMVCRALVFGQPLAPVLAALPTRQFPLIMPVPVLQRNELVIDIPEGWTIDRPARRVESRWGSLIETLEREGQRLKSVVRLQLPAQTVSPEEYPEFARFCHALDELNSRPPVMTYTPNP